MAYNAVEMADWQISEAAEENMPTPDEWRDKLGLEKDEILPILMSFRSLAAIILEIFESTSRNLPTSNS